jgi:hypothetical protein
MPVLRYFLFVGGALLALLLGANALLPHEAPAVGSLASSAELPAIRIHSDRKWPERVVFDTSQPTTAAVTVAKADVPVAAPAVTVASPKARVREAFAQLPASEQVPAVAPGPKKPEIKPQPKRKLMKARPVQQPIQQPVMLVAQQPHFGLFGNTW